MIDPAGTAPRQASFTRAFSLIAALTILGCGGPGGQFYLVQNQVAGAGCTIPADKGSLYQGEGVLDVRVPTTADAAYLLFPLLQNDLSSEGEMGVEPNRIALSGFEIELRFVDGPATVHDLFVALAADPATAALLHYQSPWSGSIAPGGGTATAITGVFPAEAARRLREGNVIGRGNYARVNASVRAVGNKLGGQIKSDVFTYPLRICDGCLIKSVTACPASGPVLKGGVCNAGQDAPVDCCTQGADLICPATSAP